MNLRPRSAAVADAPLADEPAADEPAADEPAADGLGAAEPAGDGFGDALSIPLEEAGDTASEDEGHQHHSASALREMFGRGLIYAAVFALQNAVMIIVTPLTVRNLSKYQFGRLVIALTVIQLLIVIVGLGLGPAIQRFRAEDDETYRKTRGLMGTAIVLSLLATVVVYATGPWWASLLRLGAFSSTLQLAVWSAGFMAVGMLIAELFRAEDRFGAFCWLMLPLAIGSQVLGLGFVYLVSHTSTAYLTGTTIGSLVAIVLGIILARPLLLRFSDWQILMPAFALGIPLISNGVAYQVLILGDRIVVQSQLGEFAVGRYQLAYNAAGLVILSIVLLSQTWLPRLFAIKDIALRKIVLAESRDALYRMVIPLILGVCLAAPVVLRILAPPSYRTNQLLLVVSLVAISAIPFCAYMADMRLMVAFGRTRALLWATPLAAAANIGLNIALVPVWGINGSALATVLGYGILAVATGLSSRRIARLQPPSVLLGAELGVSAGLAVAIASLPTDPVFLGLRMAGAVGCAVWTIVIVRKVVVGGPDPAG
jgi:O-antigen/teichoic acid export membrane protein